MATATAPSPETPDSIHRFWFGADAHCLDDAALGQRQAALWWSKHAETDAEIRRRFGALIDDAGAGRLNHWATTPSGLLALLLLTDQFPRNAWRDTLKAFATDEAARRLCRAGLAQGLDALLRPIERVFFYLPLEHSEQIEDQNEAVRLFESLVDQAPPDQAAAFEGYLDFARRHREVVERFGRFPHRNVILDRVSTDQEIKFLSKPGSRF